MRNLRGKNAIVTGASRGIGPHIARTLAQEGVNVALAARSHKELSATAQEIAELGVKALAIPTDVANEVDREALVRRAEAELGQIDILVNVAGVVQWTRFAGQAQDGIRQIIEVNLMAPLFLTRLVLPGMLERRQGHIVTISSLSGKKGIPYEATYSASKAGLIEWTNAARVELEGTGVGISVIMPAYVSDAGMVTGHDLPKLVGSVKARDVALAVTRAIRHDVQEIIVRPTPTRPLLAINAFSPRLGNLIVKGMGVVDRNLKLAER